MKITIKCDAGHTQEVLFNGDIDRAISLAALLDGSIFPSGKPGPDSVICRCAVKSCGAGLTATVTVDL